jgi:hypothetical protein
MLRPGPGIKAKCKKKKKKYFSFPLQQERKFLPLQPQTERTVLKGNQPGRSASHQGQQASENLKKRFGAKIKTATFGLPKHREKKRTTGSFKL